MDTTHNRPFGNQRFLMWAIGVGVAVCVALAGWFWWLAQDAQSIRSVLTAAHQKVNFDIYYPEHMPGGLVFEPTTVSVTSHVVTYAVGYDRTKSFIVSVQPKGDGFDESAFNPTSDFTTTIGHAYLADLDTRTTAVVVGESSVVVINAPRKLAVDRLTSFINALRQL